MVLVGERVRFGQAPRGVDGAGEDVQHRCGPTLATQVAVDERRHRVNPGHFDTGPTREDDHGARIGCNDGLNEPILSLGQAHVRPIQPLGLGELVKPDVDERDVSARGQVHGLGNEGVVRSPMTVITAGVPGEDEASGILSAGLKQLARSLDARRIDLGGTGALETRRVSEVADECNARARAQRQEIAIVAQERDRLGGDARGQLVMLVEVVGRGCGQAGARARDVKDLLGTRVDVSRIQFSSLDGRDDLTRTSKAGGGHLEATAGAHRCDGTV